MHGSAFCSRNKCKKYKVQANFLILRLHKSVDARERAGSLAHFALTLPALAHALAYFIKRLQG